MIKQKRVNNSQEQKDQFVFQQNNMILHVKNSDKYFWNDFEQIFVS